MIEPRLTVVGCGGVAADLLKTGGASTVLVGRAVAQGAELLKTRIVSHASGRPGPNAPTGDYRRSWSVSKKDATTAIVGTNKPQGRRLEYGFYGTDALGRTYHQPPFPHVQVSVDETESAVVTLIRAAVERAIG
jgi:hypothetical protein